MNTLTLLLVLCASLVFSKSFDYDFFANRDVSDVSSNPNCTVIHVTCCKYGSNLNSAGTGCQAAPTLTQACTQGASYPTPGDCEDTRYPGALTCDPAGSNSQTCFATSVYGPGENCAAPPTGVYAPAACAGGLTCSTTCGPSGTSGAACNETSFCNAPLVCSSTSSKCISPQAAGGSCGLDNDCVATAFCSGNTCVTKFSVANGGTATSLQACQGNLFFNNGSCQAFTNLGNSCTGELTTCGTGAVCYVDPSGCFSSVCGPSYDSTTSSCANAQISLGQCTTTNNCLNPFLNIFNILPGPGSCINTFCSSQYNNYLSSCVGSRCSATSLFLGLFAVFALALTVLMF